MYKTKYDLKGLKCPTMCKHERPKMSFYEISKHPICGIVKKKKDKEDRGEGG